MNNPFSVFVRIHKVLSYNLTKYRRFEIGLGEKAFKNTVCAAGRGIGSPLVTVCEGGALRMVQSPMSSMSRRSHPQSIALQQNDASAEPAAGQNQPCASAHAAAAQASELTTQQHSTEFLPIAELKGVPKVMVSSQEGADDGTGTQSAGNDKDNPSVASIPLPTSSVSGVADELEGRLNDLIMAECEVPGSLAEVADLAFRAAVGQLEVSQFVQAERCFQVALRACPATKTKAVAKIQTLLKHVQEQIQRTS